MASIRKSDKRIWLEIGEFNTLDISVKPKMSFSTAGLMDSYIIGKINGHTLYVPLVDAKKYVPAIAACVPSLEFQKLSFNEQKKHIKQLCDQI